ncbi:MAG: dihydropteroate synthase-like protein [Methanobrevibacter sp.]|uniref:dihydropteroate synthase-like protein n=1 Tax=Methanobrevibacter sp. TaxID=66852 RepID=UPI0025FDF276|nr:dihydropteroate synthase-like protein [Methanobrevibacter sp.]MBE6509314.1 dihydropteroate synthase-like protein [Methanobrevibacter sp.]
MKVLIITGNLAYPLIKEVISDSKEDIIVHIADNTQVAAFLTPRQIIKEVKTNFSDQLDEIDMILVPGLIKKGTREITKELGIPTFKGSTDGADLAMVLNLVNSIQLSEDKPADKLIEEEKRKEAFKFIEEFENGTENIEKLLQKPNNILIRNLPVGEDFPMRVLSEIANAPFLSKEALINKCQYFVDSGADMIDIGMAAGEDFSDKIPELIETLRPIVGDRPLSIDTLNPKEIQVAAENGIDFVLSLDLGNNSEVQKILKEKDIPAVLLPTNFSHGISPKSPLERVESMHQLIKDTEGLRYVADLILDPVNSSSIVESIIACHEFHKTNPAPMFFGVGNVTELMDADSGGVNVLLAGIGMELGVSILFTPEESGKTRGSVYELATASKMMFLAKHRKSIPKDLGINLVAFKDKHKRNDVILNELDGVPETKRDKPLKFVRDKAGSFKISVDYKTTVKESRITATHFVKNKADLVIVGHSAKEIYEEIIIKGLVTRMEHAAYLGSELQKAEIAMITGKEYVQDFDLFKNPDEFKK